MTDTVRRAARERARRTLRIAVKRGEVAFPSECSKCEATENLYTHWDDLDRPLDFVRLCAKCYRPLTAQQPKGVKRAFRRTPPYEVVRKLLIEDKWTYEQIGEHFVCNPAMVQRTFLQRARARGEYELVTGLNRKLRAEKVRRGNAISHRLVDGTYILRRVSAFMARYAHRSETGEWEAVSWDEATAAFAALADLGSLAYLRTLLRNGNHRRIERWYAIKLLKGMGEEIPVDW